MTSSAMGTRFLSLYKSIRTLHRQKLPKQMRELGDKYVRNEFQLHKNAKAEFMEKFFSEWESYRRQLEQKEMMGDTVGREMDRSEISLLDEQQKQQLLRLKEATLEDMKDS